METVITWFSLLRQGSWVRSNRGCCDLEIPNFLVATENHQDLRLLGHDKCFYAMTGLFLVATETGQGRRFYVATGHELSR